MKRQKYTTNPPPSRFRTTIERFVETPRRQDTESSERNKGMDSFQKNKGSSLVFPYEVLVEWASTIT